MCKKCNDCDKFKEKMNLESLKAQTQGGMQVYEELDIKQHLRLFEGQEEDMVKRLIDLILELSNDKIELCDRLIKENKEDK